MPAPDDPVQRKTRILHKTIALVIEKFHSTRSIGDLMAILRAIADETNSSKGQIAYSFVCGVLSHDPGLQDKVWCPWAEFDKQLRDDWEMGVQVEGERGKDIDGPYGSVAEDEEWKSKIF